MKKYFTVLIIVYGIILIGLIAVFILCLNGTITLEKLGINRDSITSGESSGSEQEQSGAAAVQTPEPTEEPDKKIIVLDPGHGLSSSSASDEQKLADGWIYNPSRGGWGEWRHWKSGTTWVDCEGSGCSGRVPSGGSCWYPIENGDRDVEPELNLNNTLSAQKYLEEMGYEVRLTRTSNSENPSMTQRLKYCYPDLDTTRDPDADAFVCIHSNAGGGRGSCYISLSGLYDQAGISDTYVSDGNELGKYINDRIVSSTSMGISGSGAYDGFPTTILFCKSPVTIAYLEIGFFDNQSDLNILKTESDSIGKAIAEGINDYFTAKESGGAGETAQSAPAV
ncbi:MAG TPA: N-acetylmuramoyl-L-alanine amidase [Firmicutes bacterium]|nr:N-acetylmuramoyl-L-alanine amidase [Bacillota bacterium]